MVNLPMFRAYGAFNAEEADTELQLYLDAAKETLEAIRRGARTLAAVKIWTRAGAGRCQGGFCGPRVVEILARELGVSPEEITRHGGHSRLLTGATKEPWLGGEEA